MGRAGGPRREEAALSVADLYTGAAAGWAAGAELVYGPLARALVAFGPTDLSGRVVLDVGAGTGAGSRALAAVGARPIAVDLVADMLAFRRAQRPPALVADVRRLPLPGGSVDGAIAPFVLNHLADPVVGFAELARVTRPGGVVLASTFSATDRLPAKAQIDAVAARHGWVPPAAYRAVREVEALLGSPDAMAAAIDAAGLDDVEAAERAVDVGLTDPARLVDYRFGQPQLAPFLARLGATTRAEVRAEAVAAVGSAAAGGPVTVTVVLGRGRVPRRRSEDP